MRLSWQCEPDGAGGVVCLAADGSGTSTSWAHPDEAQAPVHHLPPNPRRGEILARWAPRGLPRWLHVSGSAAGVRLLVHRDGQPVHQAFGSIEPAVADLVRALAAASGKHDEAVAWPPLAAASEPMSGPRFTFAPGGAPERLAAILLGPATDPPLRHLAARIAIEVEATTLLPGLRTAFLDSRAADGLGDYYLAGALLRLGDPIGVARVLDLLGASRPQWQEEAAADLAACIPSGVWASAVDGAAGTIDAATLANWFGPAGERVEFDRSALRYRAKSR